MDRMRDLLSFFIAAMAMVALICAVYEAMNQRVPSASMLATIFVISTLMFYLPRLDTFSALGISVKLQSTLDRAEEIIGRLKNLAEVNAKVTYMTMAWGNRLGSPKNADKKQILDEMNTQLSALKVSDTERREIAKPLVALIGVDLYNVYSQTMERFVFWRQQLAEREMNQNNRSADAPASFQKMIYAIAEWRKLNAGKGPGSHLDGYDLHADLVRDTPDAIMTEAQKNAAEAFQNQIVKLYMDCVAKSGYTSDAAIFLDDNMGENYISAADSRVRKLFGVEIEAQGH